MKIAISGKGGVGKTTLAALLAQTFADRGRDVLAVDGDPATPAIDAVNAHVRTVNTKRNASRLPRTSATAPSTGAVIATRTIDAENDTL